MFLRVLTAILVVCAIIITLLLVRREFSSSQPDPVSETIPSRQISNIEWQQLFQNGILLGPPESKVKIVEFYDYECPFCREIQQTLDELRKKYPDEVAVIHRHFPLPSHLGAHSAAIAAECANTQGYFEEYHAILFIRQNMQTGLRWIDIAQIIGIPDLRSFGECINQEIPSAKIESDIKLAKSLQISAIPTLIIEGNVYEGALGLDELDKIVQKYLLSSTGSEDYAR